MRPDGRNCDVQWPGSELCWCSSYILKAAFPGKENDVNRVCHWEPCWVLVKSHFDQNWCVSTLSRLPAIFKCFTVTQGDVFQLIKTQWTEFLHHRTFPPESFPLPRCRWGRMGHLPLLVASSPERDFQKIWSDQKWSVIKPVPLTSLWITPRACPYSLDNSRESEF